MSSSEKNEKGDSKMLEWWKKKKVKDREKKIDKFAKRTASQDPEYVLGRDFIIETSNQTLKNLGRLDNGSAWKSPPSVIRFLNLPKLKKAPKVAQESVLKYKLQQCTFLFGLNDEIPIEAQFGLVDKGNKEQPKLVDENSDDEAVGVDEETASRRKVKRSKDKAGKSVKPDKNKKLPEEKPKSASQLKHEVEEKKKQGISSMEVSAWVGKSNTLGELLKYVNSMKEQPSFSDETLKSMVDMIFTNIGRPLPPLQPVPVFDQKENHFINFPNNQWQQLAKVYEILFSFVECLTSANDKGVLQAKASALFQQHGCATRLVLALQSQDKRERLKLKQAITLVYDAFPELRAQFIKGIIGAFNTFLFEPQARTHNTAGAQVHSLLQVLRYILEQMQQNDVIDDFIGSAFPSNGKAGSANSPFEFVAPMAMCKAVGSLYRAPIGILSRYINQLLKCLHLVFKLFPRAMVPTLQLLFHIWPRQSAVKELLFLHQCDEIIVTLAPPENQLSNNIEYLRPILGPFIRQISRSLLSRHYEVIARTIKLLDNNPPFFFMVAKERAQLPGLYQSLCMVLPKHPDPSILFVTSMLRKHIASTAKSQEERDVFEKIQEQTHILLANALNNHKSSRSKVAWDELEQQVFLQRVAEHGAVDSEEMDGPAVVTREGTIVTLDPAQDSLPQSAQAQAQQQNEDNNSRNNSGNDNGNGVNHLDVHHSKNKSSLDIPDKVHDSVHDSLERKITPKSKATPLSKYREYRWDDDYDDPNFPQEGEGEENQDDEIFVPNEQSHEATPRPNFRHVIGPNSISLAEGKEGEDDDQVEISVQSQSRKGERERRSNPSTKEIKEERKSRSPPSTARSSRRSFRVPQEGDDFPELLSPRKSPEDSEEAKFPTRINPAFRALPT